MQRYHITLGADTSAGGKVISASSACSINGVAIALEGDTIFCPACKSPGKIHNFGPRIPESWNGKQVALQDDLCVCKCPTPPKLIANQRVRYQSVGGGASESAQRVASSVREAAQADALGEDTEQVILRLIDDLTREPLHGKRYQLKLAGKTIEGTTDADGYTKPLDAADRADLVAWRILDQE
jgi:uncharacterized Zn-binding protein involved in type VI secretion